MNKKILRALTIIIFICLSIFCVNRVVSVKADSGWDTDYDSGGSWDSGSSWDSSSDRDSSRNWDNDSGSRNERTSQKSCNTEECKKNRLKIIILSVSISILFFIPFIIHIFLVSSKDELIKLFKSLICVIIILSSLFFSIFYMLKVGPVSLLLMPISLVLVSIINQDRKQHKSNDIKYPQKYSSVGPIDSYVQITLEEAISIIPNFNIEEFNFKAYQIFYDTQIGWMEFDYDKLENILSDELYNTYKMDLEALKLKKQKNVMEDFELINTKLISLQEQNNLYIAKVMLEVKFIDYIEDLNTHKVLRGSDKNKVDNTYVLTYIRTKEEKSVNVCPKCGAEVEGNVSGVCEYCRTKLINNNYDWVMSKKEKISQR